MADQTFYVIVARAKQAKDLLSVAALKACKYELSESVFGARMRVFKIPGKDQSQQAMRTFVADLRTQHPTLDVRCIGMSVPD